MADKRILIVEDERPIREMIAFGLKREGYRVQEAANCAEARTAIADHLPDLLLLDWMLPDMSGLEFARLLKRQEGSRELPIIMLTARASEDDKVVGLQSGADDYITKPFSSRELQARIEAVLRRVTGHEKQLTVGVLKMDTLSHRITANDVDVALGPTEYRLLQFFMSHPERVFSRAQVLDRVWGGGVYVEERTVDVHIRRLRKALEPFGCDAYVQTVRGSGYRCSVMRD